MWTTLLTNARFEISGLPPGGSTGAIPICRDLAILGGTPGRLVVRVHAATMPAGARFTVQVRAVQVREHPLRDAPSISVADATVVGPVGVPLLLDHAVANAWGAPLRFFLTAQQRRLAARLVFTISAWIRIDAGLDEIDADHDRPTASP